jgi:hypothetical protein
VSHESKNERWGSTYRALFLLSIQPLQEICLCLKPLVLPLRKYRQISCRDQHVRVSAFHTVPCAVRPRLLLL